MPLFDFTCSACGCDFEELMKSGDGLPVCPQCGSPKTNRKMSVPSPLKKGAFPFKVGPVRPMGHGAPSCGTSCGSGSCPMSQGED